MGSADGEKALQTTQKKIDDSSDQGMCASELEYSSCWSRVCSSSRNAVLRDVLRGLLVLIGLALVVTVVFLLCYFLLNDIEKKEDEVIDSLIKDFTSSGNQDHEIRPDFSASDGSKMTLSDGDAYEAGGSAGAPFRVDAPRAGGAQLAKVEEEPMVVEKEAPPAPEVTFPPMAFEEGHSPAGEGGVPLHSAGFVPSPSTGEAKAPMAADGGGEDVVDVFFPEDDFTDVTYDIITDFEESAPGAECVPLRLPICAPSMPWSLTAFPNFVGDTDVTQLQESLKYFQSVIVGSRCSTRAAEYTCAILEPTCGPDTLPLPPCRAFCQDLVSTCSEFLVAGSDYNSAFQCDRFPDSENPNVCVDLHRAANAQPTVRDKNTLLTMTNPQDIPDEQPQQQPQQQQPESDPEGSQTTVDEADATPSDPQTNDEGSQPREAPNVAVVENVSEFQPQEEPVISEADPDDTLMTPEAKDEEETNSDKMPEAADTMTESPVFICDHTKFLCDDGSDCLEAEAVCDGLQHCLDNSDEFNCTKPEAITAFPVDMFSTIEDTEPESTTQVVRPNEENDIATNTPTAEADPQASRRPSLSDMLSGSALVASPSASPTTTVDSPTLPTNKLRFGPSEAEKSQAKALDASGAPSRNAFSSFGPFPFTARPASERDEEPRPSPKLSLAELLSSSSITPAASGRKETSSPFDYEEEDPVPASGQRTLSSLLSSFPSFTSPPQSAAECPELKCIDGTCITLSQVGDGVRDCSDGTDERPGNLVS